MSARKVSSIVCLVLCTMQFNAHANSAYRISECKVSAKMLGSATYSSIENPSTELLALNDHQSNVKASVNDIPSMPHPSTDKKLAVDKKLAPEQVIPGNAGVNESIDSLVEKDTTLTYEYDLKTGLLKPQINDIVALFFAEYTPYWEEGVDFNQEWFGSYSIKSEDRWEMLNKVLQSYGLSLKVTKNDVLHFNKVNN